MSIQVLQIERWGELADALKCTDEVVPPDSHMLVAEDEGKIVGCIGLQRIICVSPIWVEPELRGRGIAEGLARYADDLMKKSIKGSRGMMVTTNGHVERLAFEMGMIPIRGRLWRKDYGQS